MDISAAYSFLENSFAKRQPQSGREQQIIALQSERRVGDVSVAESHLPAKPGVELRCGVGIKCHPVIPGRAEIREKRELFAQCRSRSEFRVERFTNNNLSTVPRLRSFQQQRRRRRRV